MPSARAALFALAAVAGLTAVVPYARARSGSPLVSSSAPAVVVYGATWCSACKSLEAGLRERSVPFDVIDIDQNPSAYDAARRATGKSIVPLTNVSRGSDSTWVVGADVDAVERAYRGE